MKPRPLVSVIVPTFNRAHLLGRALRSALNQSGPSFEVIVVDDGSTDRTREVVAGFDDPRLAYVRLEANRGGAAARNVGIGRARSDYLAFLDSDDEWLPGKLAAQIERFARAHEAGETVGAVYCAHLSLEATPGARPRLRTSELHRGDVYPLLLDGWCPASTSLFMLRADVIARSGGFDEALPSFQDYDLWLRIARICRFDVVPEPFVIKHEHGGPQVARSHGPRLRGLEMLVDKWRSEWIAHGGEAAVRHFVVLHRARAHEESLLASLTAADYAGAWRSLRQLAGLRALSTKVLAKALLVASGGWRLLALAQRVGDGWRQRRRTGHMPVRANPPAPTTSVLRQSAGRASRFL